MNRLFQSPFMMKPRQGGFTLIELIITLILIATLAVAAGSRFQGRSGYPEYAFQKRLVSALRHTQTRAMQDTRDGFCHQINFQFGAGSAAFGPPTNDYSPANQAASCATTIDFVNVADFLRTSDSEITDESVSFSGVDGSSSGINYLGFDSLGRPITNLASCQSGDCRLTFTGQSSVSVCVGQQGFIYAC